ncbi:unnamed protein product [Boreogadus saida]
MEAAANTMAFEYIRRQLEEEQRHLEMLQQQLLHEQAMLLEFKWRELEEQRKAERLHKRLQQEQAFLLSLKHDRQPPPPPQGGAGDASPAPCHVLDGPPQTPAALTPTPQAQVLDSPLALDRPPPAVVETPEPPPQPRPPSSETADPDPGRAPGDTAHRTNPQTDPPPDDAGTPPPQTEEAEPVGYPPPPQPTLEADERYRKNIQGSPQTAPPPKQPPLPPRSSEPFSNGAGPAEASAMHRPMEPQAPGDEVPPRVPVRTTSRSPVLSRRESPLPTQPSNQVAQRNVGSSAEPRPLWDRVEKLQPRPGSGSSSGSSNSSSQAGSGDRFRPRSSSKSEGSPLQRPDNAAKKTEDKNLARPSRPADLTALAKELRAVDDVRPPHKVTDYSSSSDDSGTTDEEDDEEVDQEAGEESTSGAEDSRAGYSHGFYRRLSNGETESLKTMLAEDSESDQATTPSKDGTLVIRQSASELKSAAAALVAAAGTGPPEKNGLHHLPHHLLLLHQQQQQQQQQQHLPDLIQQSHPSPSLAASSASSTTSSSASSTPMPSSSSTSTSTSSSFPPASSHNGSQALRPQNLLDQLNAEETQSASSTMTKHKSSSSFTPFIDPRLLQVSPSSGSSLNNMASFGQDVRLPEALRADPSRKGSVVNVNPVNTRPQSDTPEIRKYKKRFNSEILCAALWGVNLLVGTESGLMLLDRSGQGKVYPLINRRRIQQMDVLEGLNVLVTISGKKNKLRVYYLSWLRNKILHNDPEVEKKQGWVTVGDLEGCVHYKVVKYERIKFLVLALKNAVEVYAWAPKPYHKFMAFKSFGDLVHKPLLVDLTVEEGQRLKVIYGSYSGFHAVDVDSGAVYDIYLPTHIQTSIQSHAIIILPNTDGIELLVCYEDEGVYVNTYGRITKDVVLQWGEMPTSVAYIRSNQIMGWGEKAIEIRSVETGHLDGVFMHKRAQRLKFLCERNDKVFFASVRSGGASQVYFMTLGRTSLMSW